MSKAKSALQAVHVVGVKLPSRHTIIMEFILQDNFHEEHDSTWSIFSQHYHCPVCLGCIVETLEDPVLLCIQKKPAVSELLRLLTYQAADLLQLFRQEEQVVWHLAELLLDCLKETEESFLSSSIDTCLKLVQQIGSEDLVTFFLDSIHQQVTTETNHDALLPHYTLLGKMLFQLPPLAAKLLHDYDHLLHQISSDLCSPRETIQSAVAYLFIFLCDSSLMDSVSPRLKQNLYHGVLKMLSTVQTQTVQLNGLGLLKKLLVHEESCHILMSLNVEGTTLISAVKKLLLSKREVTQIGVAQILSLVLQKQEKVRYAGVILESDLAEFLFEALHTQNVIQMESILTILYQLSQTEVFYKRCHAVYGVESVLRSLSTALDLKNPTLLKLGYSLLTEILKRQPRDIPLFVSVSMVKNCLSIIESGVRHHQCSVNFLAIKAAAEVIRKEHLMLPVPFSELSNILTAVASQAWAQLRDSESLNHKTKARSPFMEQETRETLLQTYVNMLLRAMRLAIQCKSEPATCESAFTAPSSSGSDTVPPLQCFIQTVVQIIDENCIPLFMILWDNTEDPVTYEKYFEILVCLQPLYLSVGDVIVNKLVETGFLAAVLEVKAKFRTEAGLVANSNEFLAAALRCSLIKEKTETDNWEPGDFREIVQKMKYGLSDLQQVMCNCDFDKETVEAYITVLYLSYRHDNRCLSAESLQWVLSWVVNRFTSLEQLSPLAHKHYLFLLAWSVVNEDMDMRSAIPNGIQSLQSVLDQPKESWYTHDIVILQWCYSDVVLAAISGTSVLKAYLESSTSDEIRTLITGCEDGQQHELSQLCWNPAFRQSLLDCIARASPDTVSKAGTLLEHHLLHFTLDSDDHSEEDGLRDINARLIETLQKVFLKNILETKEHNMVSLLELLLKLQKLLPAAQCLDIKILYHVLKQFGKTKQLSEETKNICLQVISMALSSNADSQVTAIVVQNEGVLLQVETSIRERQPTLPSACNILSSLVQTSNILQPAHVVSVHLPPLLNYMFISGTDTQLALLTLLANVFKVKMSTSVAKFTGRINPTNYRTLYIYLQQFIVQGIPHLQEAAITCVEQLIQYLLQTDEQLGVELLSQPWNGLMLDILVELSLETGLNEPVFNLLSLFLGHEDGVMLVTSNETLPHKIAKCFHGDKAEFQKDIKGPDSSGLKKLASQVLEKLTTFLTPADIDALQAVTL